MVPQAHTGKVALLMALTLALAACGKQDTPSGAAASASAASFPTGNGDKSLTFAGSDKLPEPKPADDSAAGRAAAVGLGQAARAACKKDLVAQQPNADLARIREIKEHEEADRLGHKKSEEEWKQGVKDGAAQPLKKYSY